MSKIKSIVKYVSLFIAAVAAAVITTICVERNFHENYGPSDYTYMIYRDRTELAMEGVRDQIVTEIDNYIDSVATESTLNGIKLFELCDQYDIDVRFAMAQAEAESHFGTKGMAAKTNVVWNVKAYDDTTVEEMKKKGHDVKHPDMSIEPYLKLLTTTYLVDGKTEYDMFDNFVDVNGKRYASNPEYEKMVFNIYERINNNTKLNRLLKDWKRYKIILGK